MSTKDKNFDMDLNDSYNCSINNSFFSNEFHSFHSKQIPKHLSF
jgi:hypothetical protein